MGFQYTERLSFIYNELAKFNMAGQTPGGMWYEKSGVAIYPKEKSYEERAQAKANGTDQYRIRVENDNNGLRDNLTEMLQETFKDCDFVTIEPPQDSVPLGPRSP